MPVMHVFMLRWDEFRDKATASGVTWPMSALIDQVLNHFKEVARKANITYLGEGLPDLNTLEEAVKKAKK